MSRRSASDDTVKDSAKEIVKDVYKDLVHPAAKETGELLALVPRTIRAALSSVEKWVMLRNYNREATEKLLAENLENTPPEMIEAPEPYIAVPALIYISYCMDNEALRNMYAKLLANAMNKITKSGVHPGYVEIIKQLCPDEAKILEYFYINRDVATINIRLENDDGFGIETVKDYSEINELDICGDISNINAYYGNLVRLGLLNKSPYLHKIQTDKYQQLKDSTFIQGKVEKYKKSKGMFRNIVFEEGYIELTSFGYAFCNVCIG